MKYWKKALPQFFKPIRKLSLKWKACKNNLAEVKAKYNESKAKVTEMMKEEIDLSNDLDNLTKSVKEKRAKGETLVQQN